MPLKCCVPCCKSNYSKQDINNELQIPVFRLPQALDQRKLWLSVIPRSNTPDTKFTVVCAKHWPVDYATVTINGKERPLFPPSVFPDIPSSLISTVSLSQRQTKRCLSSVRNVIPDELPIFNDHDAVLYDDIVSVAHSRLTPFSVITFLCNNHTVIQSTQYTGGISQFLIRIFPSFLYEAFHFGVQCFISSLAQNRISKLDKWSKILEAVRFLKNAECTHMKNVILDQLNCMKSVSVGSKVYSIEAILRGFEYFAMSRALYQQLRKDFRLPSIRILSQITSKASKLEDLDYIAKIFDKLDDMQKNCIILIDEIYVKPCLRYQGGEVFGKAVNNSLELARTVLAIMVQCQFGGPVFMAKIIPVFNVNASFQYEQVKCIIQVIQNCSGKVNAIVCDNNHVNQKFYQLFNTVPGKPWLVESEQPIFLLFDYVHIWKSIRNNWMTEKTQEINFRDPANGITLTAKWHDLYNLHQLELNSLVTLSRLNSTAINPKPIERQNVSLYLRIFCEETLSALRTHPEVKHDEVIGTATFLQMFIRAWKIVNVKSMYNDLRLKDTERGVISDAADTRLSFLLQVADMVDNMKAHNSGKRFKTFTIDTCAAISMTL